MSVRLGIRSSGGNAPDLWGCERPDAFPREKAPFATEVGRKARFFIDEIKR